MEEFKLPLEKIQEVFDHAVPNKLSSFYRNFYKGTPKVTSLEDFLALPVLTRDDILNVDLKDRVFLTDSEIKGYSVTSGTTGNRKILMMPFSHPSLSFHGVVAEPSKMKRLGAIKIMLLTSPLHGMVRHLIYSENPTLPFVLSKVEDFELSAAMVKEAGIEGIISTPTVITLFAEKLVELGIAGQIKWVCLAGEHCSRGRKRSIEAALPNATVEVVYGSAEAGIIGTQCNHLMDKPNSFHPAEELYLEVVDENNQPQSLGTPGNIIITSLVRTAFPLIRYSIKDMGVLEEKRCACGKQIFTLLGRADYDSVKIQGVVIHAAAIERALATVSEAVMPEFEAGVYENDIRGKRIPLIALKLILRNPVIEPKEFAGKLANKISENLWLSPKNTLADLVKKEIFSPLEINFVTEIKKEPGLKSSLVRNHTIT